MFDQPLKLLASSPQGLNGEGNKAHACFSACFRVCRSLPLLSHLQGVACNGGGSRDGEVLQRRDDCNVQGSRPASLPVGQVDVRGTAAGAWDESWCLLPGTQGCRLGCGVNDVADGVVPENAIAITSAAHLVVPESVCRTLTDWAGVVFAYHGQPQPVLQTQLKMCVREMEPKSWRRDHLEPVPSMRE